MTEKVLVTGGAGFIGSHVVDMMVMAGYSVSVLDNLSTGKVENLNKEAKFYKGDIRADAEQVFESEKPDYVIHHAGQISVVDSARDPLNDAEQNISGSIALLELCKKYGIKKVLFASSSSVYGNADSFPTKEDAPLRPMNPYAISKSAVERYLQFYHDAHGISYVAMRYGNVYGPRQNPKGEAGVIAVFIDQILDGKAPCIWGDGNQVRDFVYVDDIAEANFRALGYQRDNRVFNIGTGQGASIKDIYSVLYSKLRARSPEFNHDFVEAVPRITLDSSSARQELGWTSTISLEEGIMATARWFRERRALKGQ